MPGIDRGEHETDVVPSGSVLGQAFDPHDAHLADDRRGVGKEHLDLQAAARCQLLVGVHRDPAETAIRRLAMAAEQRQPRRTEVRGRQ